MKPFIIRAASPCDLTTIMLLYDHSRQLMRNSGNYEQWVNGYPSQALIEEDIRLGRLFVICSNNLVVGVFAFILGRDITYEHIYEGSWQEDDRPYGTLHRIARSPDGHGIFSACVEWSRQQCTSLRIDTHAINRNMRHLIEREGFSYRGIIYLADGSPRLAYQMLNTKTLCHPLVHYIEQQILPRYETFDTAHRRDHAETVIRNSLDLAQHYDVEINTVYTIAAYHDLGLAKGREQHHIVSGEILLADKQLLSWFSRSQLLLMAEAIEDHRASAKQAPRSLYGRIVAEADRDIEPLKIIRRTVQFGLSNHPQLDKEQQWQRTLDHLHEKYSEDGYLQLWLPESHNATALRDLRHMIADKTTLREIFNRFYREEMKKK